MCSSKETGVESICEIPQMLFSFLLDTVTEKCYNVEMMMRKVNTQTKRGNKMEDVLKIIKVFSPIITVVISAIISFVVSRISAKSEIKKLTLANEREDKKQYEELLSDLMRETEKFCLFNSGYSKLESIKTNAKLIAYAPKEVIPVLKEMDIALSNENTGKIKELRTTLLNLITP